MDESVYRRLNVDVTPNAAISPNNATEGDKLVADNNDDFHWFYQNVTVVSGTEHTFSIFVKAGAVTEVSIRLQALSGSADRSYLYDLALGTGNGYIESFPNGWYRLSGSFTPDTTSGRFFIFISGDQTVYEGNGASLYIWGAQVEEGSFPTSYIPTAGTQVTRAADNCVRMLGDEFNPSEGTIYFEGVIVPSTAGGTEAFNTHFGLFISTSNRVSGLFGDGSIRLYTGTNITDYNLSGFEVGQAVKAAISYSGQSIVLVVNGVVVANTTGDFDASVFDSFSVSNTGGESEPSQSINRSLFPEALSEAELITLTGGN